MDVAGVDEKEAVLDMLLDIKMRNVLVVVEGLKDKRALFKLGITNVMVLSKPLYAVVEEIESLAKEVVLLVDLDAEGKKIYNVLKRDLMNHKVKVDDSLRRALFRTPIRHIEGLATYLSDS